jgi:hypothetical protein
MEQTTLDKAALADDLVYRWRFNEALAVGTHMERRTKSPATRLLARAGAQARSARMS